MSKSTEPVARPMAEAPKDGTPIEVSTGLFKYTLVWCQPAGHECGWYLVGHKDTIPLQVQSVDSWTWVPATFSQDDTDWVDPAFYRGMDNGVKGAVNLLKAALDGTDDGSGVAADPDLEHLRRRISAGMKQYRCLLEQEAIRVGIASPKPGTPPSLLRQLLLDDIQAVKP